MTHILCAQNSDSKCSHDENDGKKKQKIDKQEANSNSESDKGTKSKHLCSDIDSSYNNIYYNCYRLLVKPWGESLRKPLRQVCHLRKETVMMSLYASISAEFKTIRKGREISSAIRHWSRNIIVSNYYHKVS